MLDLMIYAIVSALASAFILCFLYKTKVIEQMQMYGGRIISELAHCEFCLSFWANVFVTIMLIIVSWNIGMIFIPLFSTPITRFLIK